MEAAVTIQSARRGQVARRTWMSAAQRRFVAQLKEADRGSPLPSVVLRSNKPWLWSGEGVEDKGRLRDLFSMFEQQDSCHSTFQDSRAQSGTVTSTELMHMLVNLGEEVDEALVADMVKLVDLNGDGQIDFDEFYSVMCGEKRVGQFDLPEEREEGVEKLAHQMTAEEMRALFNDIDTDQSGYLDQREMKLLVDKVAHRMNARHLVDVFKSLDPENSDRIYFGERALPIEHTHARARAPLSLYDTHGVYVPGVPHRETPVVDTFRNWLLDAGRHWSDLLVLPEGGVFAIRELAASPKTDPPPCPPSQNTRRTHTTCLTGRRSRACVRACVQETLLPPDDIAALTVHVRGVAGTYESADALEELFSRYGEFSRATVRQRFDQVTGENTSWALVTMETPEDVRNILGTEVRLPSGRVLDINLYHRPITAQHPSLP